MGQPSLPTLVRKRSRASVSSFVSIVRKVAVSAHPDTPPTSHIAVRMYVPAHRTRRVITPADRVPLPFIHPYPEPDLTDQPIPTSDAA